MQSKPWYSSRTIVSAVVGLLGWLLNHVFHANVADLLPGLADALVNWIANLMTLAGFIGAIVGRIQAVHVLAPTRAAANAANTLSQAQLAPLQGAAASKSPGTISLAGEPAGGVASRGATSVPGAVPMPPPPSFPAKTQPLKDRYTS